MNSAAALQRQRSTKEFQRTGAPAHLFALQQTVQPQPIQGLYNSIHSSQIRRLSDTDSKSSALVTESFSTVRPSTAGQPPTTEAFTDRSTPSWLVPKADAHRRSPGRARPKKLISIQLPGNWGPLWQTSRAARYREFAIKVTRWRASAVVFRKRVRHAARSDTFSYR